MRAILAALGVLALAGAASAATLKVPQQYDTIQSALNDAMDGDTVLIGKGVYNESCTSWAPNLKILGKGAVIDSTIGTSHQGGLAVFGAGTTIQGVTFRNGSTQLSVYATGCHVLKCTFNDARYAGIYVGYYDGTEISGCRIKGAEEYGFQVYGSSGTVGSFTKNTVRQTGGTSVYIQGNGAAVYGNKVSLTEDGTSIYVGGPASQVSANTVSGGGANGIYVQGTGAVVQSNKVGWIQNGTGLYVGSDNGVVSGNTVAVAPTGVQVYGYDTQVTGNKASGFFDGGFGIYVGGDRVTVTGNSASNGFNDGTGFYVYSYTGAGGGTFSGNTAVNCANGGFTFSGMYNVTVSACRAIDCGSRYYERGFNFSYSSGNTIENCLAQGNNAVGFYVLGNDNEFTRCAAKDNLTEGFEVYGNGNKFHDCSAFGHGGEGFNNGGTNTLLDGGSYLHNRQDITNMSFYSATFTGGLLGVHYDTGGPSVDPEVWVADD